MNTEPENSTTASGKPELPTEVAKRWAECEAAERNLKKAQQPQHSPMPWHVSRLDDDEHMIRDSEQADIAVLIGANEANAKLIVASVNHAAQLAEALREIVDHPYWKGISSKAAQALAAYESEAAQ